MNIIFLANIGTGFLGVSDAKPNEIFIEMSTELWELSNHTFVNSFLRIYRNVLIKQ